nr:uncharacterized protein LOC128691262 [Cherax quadricarinatus]
MQVLLPTIIRDVYGIPNEELYGVAVNGVTRIFIRFINAGFYSSIVDKYHEKRMAVNTAVEETIMMENFDGTWIREAAPFEYFCEVAHQDGTLLICYRLNLKTREPLQEEHVRQALILLHRKVPCLRVKFQERDGTSWLREATCPNVDFKVVPESNVYSVMERLRTYRYNSATGPLWCARLMSDVSCCQSIQTSAHKTDDRSVFFRHSHQLFVGFHHGIVDGWTAMKICGWTVTLLNDVISGKPVNNDQLGEHVSPKQTMELLLARKALIEANPKLIKKLTDGTNLQQEMKSFFQLINQMPKEIEETKSFIHKCRAERVTVHSAFTALTGAALTDLLTEKGIVQDTYNIRVGHLINMRRYWKGDVSRSLGCHILKPLLQCIDTSRNVLDKFWDFARSVHQELQRNIEDGTIIGEEAFA